MKNDFIRIDGIEYTHLLKEDVWENLNTTKGNNLVTLDTMKSYLIKNDLLAIDNSDYHEGETFIGINKNILYSENNYNIVPIKFKTIKTWENSNRYWANDIFKYIVLGQNLKLEVYSKNGNYDIFIKVAGPKRTDIRTLIEYKDYRQDNADDLIESMFSRQIPKILF